MRGQSHLGLGRYLAEQYMVGIPKNCVRAFMIGCIEPDRNPGTYFKGSLRAQMLRGHNWDNASRFIRRLSARLEKKNHWTLWDYYSLGKLTHYIADGFTSAHNSHFGSSLTDHRSYEILLQDYFLNYLAQLSHAPDSGTGSVEEIIQEHHRSYLRKPVSIHTDTRFAVMTCCAVTAKLMP